MLNELKCVCENVEIDKYLELYKYVRENMEHPEWLGTFTKEEINYAWSRAKVVKDVDQSKWRQDYAGAWICRDAYGDIKSEYGWEIDHQKPLALDGTYDLDNLFPLQWNNNRTKGDDYPIWKTSISSFFMII